MQNLNTPPQKQHSYLHKANRSRSRCSRRCTETAEKRLKVSQEKIYTKTKAHQIITKKQVNSIKLVTTPTVLRSTLHIMRKHIDESTLHAHERT